jgi:hypothetical protein
MLKATDGRGFSKPGISATMRSLGFAKRALE